MDTQTETDPLPAMAETFQRYYSDGEEYVRSNPAKSALLGVGAGFLLAQLPLRLILMALVKLLLHLVKPALFVYAISKLVGDWREDGRVTR